MAMLAGGPLLSTLPGARGQQKEARSYGDAPVGVDLLVAGYQYEWGDVLVDPSLPIKNADAKVNTLLLGYSRVLDFWGQSGTLAVLVPYAWLSANGEVEGQARSVTRTGFGDLGLRWSVNFLGAPALSLEQFRDYHQDTIAGASLTVTAPTGQYDNTKLVN